METKRAVCTVCDIACQLHVGVKDGRVLRVTPPDNPIVADVCAAAVVRRPGKLRRDAPSTFRRAVGFSDLPGFYASVLVSPPAAGRSRPGDQPSPPRRHASKGC